LLNKEALLANIIQQALFAIPRHDRLQEFGSFIRSTKITELYNEDGIPAWSSGKDDVGVEFPGDVLDAIAEMFYQGSCRRAAEFAGEVTDVRYDSEL